MPRAELTTKDVAYIDLAGSIGARQLTAKTALRRAAGVALVVVAALGACAWLGVDVL